MEALGPQNGGERAANAAAPAVRQSPAQHDRSTGSAGRIEQGALCAADHALIERVIRCAAGAEREFVARYDRLIVSILRRCGASVQDSEDLRQQVYLHLWANQCQCLRQWEGRRAARFSTYLCVLVRRIVCRHFARQAQLPPCASLEETLCGATTAQPISAEWGDPHRLSEAHEREQALLCALNRLPERDRQLIRQRHLHEWSYREIGAHFGMTVNHVGVALYRAESRLRRILTTAHADLFGAETGAPKTSAGTAR